MEEVTKIIEPGSVEDPDNPQRILSQIGENPIPVAQRGQKVYIPYEKTKFVCPNHKVIMTINMSDNPIRKRSNQMTEYECDCGVIYIRTNDLRQLK